MQVQPWMSLRNVFFSLVLLCLALPLGDASTYQLMQFVLLFKGTQFFTGLAFCATALNGWPLALPLGFGLLIGRVPRTAVCIS